MTFKLFFFQNPAGLPFNPEFAITHITELPSRAADGEVLRAGPTSWGTVLQLPDSWVEAVSTAQLPEEQPLSTALEVGGLSCHTDRHTSTVLSLFQL